MNDHDLALLRMLRADCRVKHTAVATELGWPVSTTHERVKRCIKQYVKRHTCLLDWNLLGYGTRALWIVRPHNGEKETWEERVRKDEHVNTLLRMHHGNYLVESIAKTSEQEQDLSLLLSQGGTIIAMHPVISELAQERFLADGGALPTGTMATGNHAAGAK